MKELSLNIKHFEIRGIVPDDRIENMIYVLEPAKVLYNLGEFIKRKKNTGMVSIFGMDWDNDLSPWHEKKIFKKGRDFGGHADDFRIELLYELIPSIEKSLCLTSPKRYLAGISLAGLFALHTSCHTKLFEGIASVSGSLWFKDFIPWLEGHKPEIKLAYLSVGAQEKNTRNPIIATTEDCNRKTVEILKRKGIEAELEINPGGHFDDGPIRIEKALRWLLQTSAELEDKQDNNSI